METVRISGFNKVNEFTNSEKLSDSELTKLTNMRLDEEIGVPTLRKGFSRYGQQVDTAGDIHSLFDVVDENGTNYLLAGVGNKLRKSTGSAYSDVKTGLSGNKLRMANFGGNFIFTNGVDSPFHTKDFTAVDDISIPRPDMSGVSISLGGSTAPKLSDGIYKYIFIYVTKDGQKSPPSVPIQPRLQSGGYDYINMTPFPTVTDSRIVSLMIFRTKANKLDTYYLLTILDKGETSYTDDTPDANLNTAEVFEYMTYLNTAKYIATKNDRIFLANINKTYKNRVLPPANLRGLSSPEHTLILSHL